MAGVKFSIRGKQNPTSIYVRLRAGRNVDLKCKTRFVINPKDWSDAKGEVKNLKDDDLKALDSKLLDFQYELIKHYNAADDKTFIDSSWLSDFINPSLEDKKGGGSNSLVKYFETYGQYKKHELSSASITKLNVVMHLLERFEKHRRKKINIVDVNHKFKLEYENYCRTEKYAKNTIARSLKFIKTVCYHARYNGIATSPQLDSITTKGEKVEKIYLTPAELEKIQSEKLAHDYLENARDWLIISCETGQRVSDFMRFTKSMIRLQTTSDGKKEIPLIEFTQQKTQKIMAVPLSQAVMKILKKKNGEFPRAISSAKYNKYIKEVCKVAKIEAQTKGSKIDPEINRKVSGVFPKHELVSSHVGRRSFASNNYGKIPTPLLMSATGHTTEKMFLEYIGKSEMDRAIQLAEYFV